MVQHGQLVNSYVYFNFRFVPRALPAAGALACLAAISLGY